MEANKQLKDTTSNTNEKLTREDLDCPICTELMAAPHKTICGHLFCIACYKKTMERDSRCPLCRNEFEKNFKPKVDNSLHEYVQKNYPEEYENRKKQLEDMNLWCLDKIMLQFAYGNLHSTIKLNGIASNHNWSMFVSLNENKEWTDSIIKKVDFTLHKTFKNPEVAVTQYPFLVRRIGWGTFEINFTIHFQPWTKLKSKKMSHELVFEGSGKTKTFFVEIKQEDLLNCGNENLIDKFVN